MSLESPTPPGPLPDRLAAAAAALADLTDTITTVYKETDEQISAARASWRGNTAEAIAVHHRAMNDAVTATADRLGRLQGTLEGRAS